VYKYICRQWKNRKITVLFIIIGFMVGSLVISLGISACRESFAYADDRMRGNPERQLDIFLSNNNMWKQKDVEELIEALGSYGEVQLMSMDSRQLESFGESSPVVPVLFHRKPHWHVPLLEGRYFSVDEMEHSEKVIVLGKQLAERYQIGLEDMVDIGGAGFRVIGICGRQARETSWEYAVYMPWAEYLELYPGCFEDWEKGTALTVHLEDGKKELLEQIEQYIDGAAEKGIQMNYRPVDDVDTSAIRNTLILTTVSTVIVFSTAVINIIHLMLYWLLERKREIGIMKALGADNGAVVRAVVLEVAVVGAAHHQAGIGRLQIDGGLLRHAGCGPQQEQALVRLRHALHQVGSKVDAGHTGLQRPAQDFGGVHHPHPVGNDQIRFAQDFGELGVFAGPLHQLRVGGGHQMGAVLL